MVLSCNGDYHDRSLFLIYETAVDDPVTGIVGLSVPFIGALVYYIFDVKNKKVQ